MPTRPHSPGVAPSLLPAVVVLCLACNPIVPAEAQPPSTPPAAPPGANAPPSGGADSGVPSDAIVPPVSIQRVEVRGNRMLKTEDISRIALAAADRPADRTVMNRIADAVLRRYRRDGYAMAQVTDAEVTADGVLHLTVAEGIIRQITVRGNTRTRTHTIFQALEVRAGSVYNEKVVQRDRKRLGRLGIFADISIAPQAPGSPVENERVPEESKDEKSGSGKHEASAPAPAAGTSPGESVKTAVDPAPPAATPLTPPEDNVGMIDLVVRVKDQPTVNVAATVGYTDTIGAVGFLDLSENNLLGTGHRIGVEWQRTAQTEWTSDGTLKATNSRSAAGLSYEVPAIGPRSLAFGADIYNRNTVFLPYFAGGRETIRSYERRSGARGRFGKLLSDNLEAFVTARRDIVGYDPVPIDLNPPVEELATASGTVGALGFDIIADGRDSVDTPERGYRHEIQFERAGTVFGGNRSFSQWLVDLRRYTPLRPQAENAGRSRKTGPVLATRLMGGYSYGDVPLSEQFFLGGFDLLRGYDLFSVRGDRFALSTAEVRIPIGSGLQAVGFTDIGEAWEPGTKAQFDDLKASIGIGLRFFSPIGPIRLDAAYGSKLQTYISLGQSF